MKETLKYLNNLIKEDDSIIISLSGGPDSMCLLSLLLEVRKTKKINLIATHINHNVRKVSDKEKIFVEKFCLKNNIPFEYLKIEKYKDNKFTESEARKIRYDFLESIVKKYKANYLMTAHHGDDLIETVMMRIVRGSNLNGYAGFKMVTVKDNYQIIRPLMHLTKKSIIKYNKENKIPYVIDASNKKTKYTRNRYRKYLLPFLKKEDALVHEKFIKFSNELYNANEYIYKEVLKIVNKLYKDNTLDLKEFNKQDDFVKDKIISYILKEIYGDDITLISDINKEDILNLIKSKKSNSVINLPNNIMVKKSYDNLVFTNNNIESSEYKFILDNKQELPNHKVIEIIKECSDKSNYVTRLNSKEIKLPLIIRTRQKGDKMNVKKLNGTKKVKDIFIDEKINLSDRDICPVVTDSNNIVVWIPGIKKSKFDKEINEKYDIIIKYH